MFNEMDSSDEIGTTVTIWVQKSYLGIFFAML